MKLVSYEVEKNASKKQSIGLLFENQILDLNSAYRVFSTQDAGSSFIKKSANLYFPPNMISFFKTWKPGYEKAQEIQDRFQENPEMFSEGKIKSLYDRSEVKLLAPVPRPNTIRDFSTFVEHQRRVTLKKQAVKIPDVFFEVPVYWKANPDNTIGPEDDIYWPSYSEKLDYELEFGLYISRQGKNIPVEDAEDYIAGYTIFNDISARDQQEKEMVMTFGPAKGKDFDHSKVFGPCLVTPDEFSNIGNLMRASVNGELWSESTTDGMIWTFAQMIAYVSQSETLYPGDFLASGTCPTGCGLELDRWIQPGDVIELEVDGIGKLQNKVVRLDN
mgnify:CR=1 FL=1